MSNKTPLHTVLELPEFSRMAAKAGMTEEEVDGLILQLATQPDAGTSLGGGLYKTRVARKGAGKSGGYRVIYFYKATNRPIFLLTAFAKNRQSNLSSDKLAALTKICAILAKEYGK